MGDTCEICKKNPAKISIGNHSYCFDCHNKMALHDMGIHQVYLWNLQKLFIRHRIICFLVMWRQMIGWMI